MSFSKEYLREHILIEQMNSNFLLLSTIPTILLLLTPAALVFGQTNPWALFQQLCQGGVFAAGPQCQNLGTFSSSSVCGTNAILQNGVCVPTTSSTTTNGVCGTNAILQNGVCVPTTSSTTTNGVCGTNAILQNGVCVPTTSSTTTNGVCGTNAILQNGVCVPTTSSTTTNGVCAGVC
jgi:hypothetical protein